MANLTYEEKLEQKLLKEKLKEEKRLQKIEEDLAEEEKKREYIRQNEQEIMAYKKHRAEVHKKNSPPKRSVLEEVGNATTHGIGALMGIAALILMVVKADGFREMFCAFIYGFSMIFMMTMSCLYHALPNNLAKHVLRRFDYSSIYILIGGTFTPMFLLFLYDFFPHLSIVLCAVQWGVIILGLINVAIFGPGRHKAINMSLYITLGWCGITFIPYLIENDLPLLWYILLGGIVYTIGILPFILKKKGAHFIWHFFVLGGAILQFIGIFVRLYC